jgi:hypothetical protein
MSLSSGLVLPPELSPRSKSIQETQVLLSHVEAGQSSLARIIFLYASPTIIFRPTGTVDNYYIVNRNNNIPRLSSFYLLPLVEQ